MCPHDEFKKIGEKLKKFVHGWRIFDVMECVHCKGIEEEATGFFVYGRGKNWEKYEKRYEVKVV